MLLAALALACQGATTPSPTPSPDAKVSLVAQEVASGLDFPASFAFSPDGRVFFTERLAGRVRILQGWQLEQEPFAAFPVAQRAETGLLGLALHPRFPRVPYLYVYYTYQQEGAIYNRLSRLREEGGKGVDEEVLLDRIPAASFHNGGALAFGPDGKLYVTTGDSAESSLAQRRDSLAGKVLRLNDDGAIPADNPFPGSPVYTLGHRNVFGIAFHPDGSGQAYITENGTTRDDEVNRLMPSANYGWPLHLGVAHAKGYQDPVFTFTPNIAPTQALFYTGNQLPSSYRGNLFFGDWNTGGLHRLVLDETGAVKAHEVALRLPGQGILDVEQGPDGHLYLSTATGIYRVVVQP